MAVGRPREFNVDKALDRALKVFWRKGYEGASLPELTKAMGINRPSLYAAFGNKEALFQRAIERYQDGPGAHVKCALAEPTARAVIERWLRGGVVLITAPGQPAGCFMVQGALACGDSSQRVRREMAKRRAAAETALRERLEQAQREGDLPRGYEPASLAKYVMAVMHGMAVQANGGASRAELMQVVDIVMRQFAK